MNPIERLREIVTALGLSGSDTEQMWFDASNPVCRDAEKLLRAGRAAEAEESFHRVLNEPRHAALARKHLPRILLALATAQVRQQKWEEAERTAARAWALLSELRYRTSPEFAECCRLRAEAAKGRGAREEALRLYLQGLAAVEEQKRPRPAEVVRRRIDICALLRDMERWQDAEQQAAKAVELAAGKLEGAREQGDALLEWAMCLAGCERFDEAREAGEKAAAIHRACCGDFSGDVAHDYEKLGSICQRQGDYPAAVSYLEKALNVKEHQVGGDTSEFALLLVALADLYTLIGRLAPALELLQQAVGKLGPSKDGNLAGALEKLGAMYVRTGRYEDAADCYKRAFDYWSADPETHADRISANRQALESLIPWLPAPEAAPGQEAPDPGISVLKQDAQPGGGESSAVQGAGDVPRGARPGMEIADALMALSDAPGLVPPQVGVAGPAPQIPAAGSVGPAVGPGPVAGPLPLAARPPAPPQETLEPVHFRAQSPGFTQARAGGGRAPASVQTLAAGRPQGAPGIGGLHALDIAVSARRDEHGFCGWEDLDFEPLKT